MNRSHANHDRARAHGKSLLARWWRWMSTALVAGVTSVAVLTAPSEVGQVHAAAEQQSQQVVHIGYQKYGTLNILKATGGLDKRLAALGYKVQ